MTDSINCSYGEKGASAITGALQKMFAGTAELKQALTTAPIHPLKSSEFIRRVLVPEAAVLLIQEDRDISRAQAIQTLEDSRRYGMVVFPDTADSDESDSEVPHDFPKATKQKLRMKRKLAPESNEADFDEAKKARTELPEPPKEIPEPRRSKRLRP